MNGVFGLRMDLELESWRLQLVGMNGASQHPLYVEDVTAWDYRYKTPSEHEDKDHDTKVDPKLSTANKMAPEAMQAQAEEDENHTGRMARGTEEAGESGSTLPPKTAGLLLPIAEVTKLPRHELVTQFKCIEGWSQIVHWAGVRMADFLETYPPAKINGKDPFYVYMETPDGNYYTGYDLDVMRHPQTMLVTEMMEAPLTQLHGAPLRLHMPTKYGYKQIKRIGLIAYTNDKPDDYWTKLGYDWYAGL
ncbi:Sulfite oxidase [Acidisarcina polymorpha]|uniref:Sulfite oxidase n=1 Tax=Acidisarcina polymorpha TaxID=2211140 RepID=A0A2Z5G4D7_9BACT|nr:Sulfite oxidase [Acidisarcina polymorpha]